MQSALQEKLGTHSDLEMISSGNLDYILQEYSMVLHSDIIIYDSNGFQHSASSSDLKGLGARRKNEGASRIMNANAKCNLTLYPKTEESILGKKYATEYAYLYNATASVLLSFASCAAFLARIRRRISTPRLI